MRLTRATQNFILVLGALALAGALLLTDRVVPEWLSLSIAGVIGALAVKRPGDTSPTELARVLEDVDPTVGA